MPKLPDDTALGTRPTPRATRRVPDMRAAGRGISRAAQIQAREAGRTGTGLAVFGQGLGEAGTRIAAAEERVLSRADAVARAREVGIWHEKATAELLRLSEEDDMSSPDVAERFNQNLRNSMREAVQAHTGSADSRARLATTLEERRSVIAGKAASMALQAQKANVETVLNTGLNELVANARQFPGSLGSQRLSLRQLLREYEDGLTATEERAYLLAGDSILVEAAVESLIFSGEVDAAERNLLDQPGILASLAPDAQKRLFGKIAAFRAEEREAETAGFQARAELRAFLGREPTPAELAEKAGITPSPEKLVEIGDPTSPTGSRFVPASHAVGKPGRERAPVVSITEAGETEVAKQLGKLDAERVVTLEENAQQAFRTIAEVDRMDAAIESGRFTTGVFSDTRVFLARLAEFVGASQETRDLLGDAATSDTLDAASNRLGVEAAQKLSRITNMSLQFIRDSLPGLTRTPEGNRILIEVMRRTADREIQLAGLADQFIQDHGTLRPERERTYFQAVRDLEENDPVITEELRARIIAGSQKSPRSFREVFASIAESSVDIKIPGGFEFVRMQDDKAVIRNTATGEEFLQE